MNVQQINNIRYLNQNNNSSCNNQYYKTEPMENDSISFKGLPIQRWKIPQANTGLKKMLFGTWLSAAAVWTIEKGFNFIPFTEGEITRATSSNTEKQSEVSGIMFHTCWLARACDWVLLILNVLF